MALSIESYIMSLDTTQTNERDIVIHYLSAMSCRLWIYLNYHAEALQATQTILMHLLSSLI